MDGYSMPGYFQHMPQIGTAIPKPNEENEAEIKEIEAEIRRIVQEKQAKGRSDES